MWVLAYDVVPNHNADDTLVLVWRSAWGRTVRLAEIACVVDAIRDLGLEVSAQKSEVMWLCKRADHGTPPAGYRLGGVDVEVSTRMKYLDLTLDSHWTFGDHFERLVPSTEATANALRRLLPRPGVGLRRLYAGVVRSRFLYGSPIWAGFDDLDWINISLRGHRGTS